MSAQLSAPAAEEHPAEASREYATILAETRATVARTSQLLVAHRSALATLRASLAEHVALRRGDAAGSRRPQRAPRAPTVAVCWTTRQRMRRTGAAPCARVCA